MIQDLFILNGYGQFVWPAFMFTFLSCYILYIKTLKEFKKQEKLFLSEFKQIKIVKIENNNGKKVPQEALSNNSFF